MEDFNLNEAQRYERAKKKAKEIRAFYINLCCYCIVIPCLIIVNLTFSPEYYWFLFSMLGWGIGLTFHAMNAFKWYPFLGRDWEERKIRQFMEEEARKKQTNTKNE